VRRGGGEWRGCGAAAWRRRCGVGSWPGEVGSWSEGSRCGAGSRAWTPPARSDEDRGGSPASVRLRHGVTRTRRNAEGLRHGVTGPLFLRKGHHHGVMKALRDGEGLCSFALAEVPAVGIWKRARCRRVYAPSCFLVEVPPGEDRKRVCSSPGRLQAFVFSRRGTGGENLETGSFQAGLYALVFSLRGTRG